jgi:hypothetical protein
LYEGAPGDSKTIFQTGVFSFDIFTASCILETWKIFLFFNFEMKLSKLSGKTTIFSISNEFIFSTTCE